MQPEQLVQRSAAVLDRIVKNFNEQALVEDGGAEVDKEAPERDHVAILRGVVAAELPELDEFFLAALGAYLNAASKREDKHSKQLLRLLLAVREEVLRAVGSQLPVDIQLVEALTALPDRAQRAALLDEVREEARAEAEEGPEAGEGTWRQLSPTRFPGLTLEAAENAAARLVEQMEGTDAVVADPVLLSRAVLAREAVRDALSRDGPPVAPSPPPPPPQPVATAAFPPSQLPRWEMGLLKELLTVGDPVMRRGLLRHAMSEALALNNNPDDSASRGGMRPAGARPAGMRPISARAAAQPNADEPAPVRPGRLLDCIATLCADVAKNEGYVTAAELGRDPMARRAMEVREELLISLEDMAQFR